MTYGADVIRGIYSVIGNEDCLGESYHITESCSYTWNDILEVYLNAIESKTGKRPKVKMTDKSTCFKVGWNKYQIIYCRYYDRSFDNAKIGQYVNVDSFRHADEQLSECIGNFIDNPSFGQINWLLEAVNDRITHEWTPLSEIPGKKDKAKYLIYRLRMEWALKILKAVRQILLERSGISRQKLFLWLLWFLRAKRHQAASCNYADSISEAQQ